MWNSYEKEYRQSVRTIERLEREAKFIREDHEHALKRVETQHKHELITAVAKAESDAATKTNELNGKVVTLGADNRVANEKVAMYEKAFENLGFDVKDMKDILNKLVDGIVTKNEIKVLKA